MMQKYSGKKGFTLAETLIVVAIIIILLAVAFVQILSYMRSLTKLQYDIYAKEIFIAAQNHLSMAESQGYLGRAGTDFGTAETAAGQAGTPQGTYYFVVRDGSAVTTSTSGTSVLDLMLPVAAVDETLRLGGSYIVRYHKDSAQVQDVFYWSEKPGRFRLTYNDDYEAFMANRENKEALKNYNGAVVGYYGGVNAAGLTRGEEILAPEIVVTNAEKLYVTVRDTNDITVPGYKLKLVITGKKSGMSREIELDASTATMSGGQITCDNDGTARTYTVLLDDITQKGMHFYNLFCSGASNNLIPGEDITIQAVALNNAQLTNVGYSSEQTTNSLFESRTTDKAMIGNIRHLENLSRDISGCTEVNIAAEQTTDLSWTEFKNAISSTAPDSVTVYSTNTSGTGVNSGDGYFFPIDKFDGPGQMTYDGKGHSISDVAVAVNNGDAGLFGRLDNVEVSNLKLIDFSVSGRDAGTLAGTAKHVTVSNVVAYHTGGSSAVSITGATGGSAGGLIGTAESCKVRNSAAALTVSAAQGSAGGLIGYMYGGAAEITGCYSGGHTEDAAYSSTAFNVTGKNAGGLVGKCDSTIIGSSYSTCSANGADYAGGLVGYVVGTRIEDSYATGLVGGEGTKGAFAGSFTGGAMEDCQYLEIINEIKTGNAITYLQPVGSSTNVTGITALDEDTSAYRTFVGDAWDSAVAYDPTLNRYYQGNYILRTVEQLGATVGSGDFVAVHYGDWPAPELWVINTK